MKTLFALIKLILVVAFICSPLYMVWLGITAELSLWEHIIVTGPGLLLCRLIKPVSVLTGKDFIYF